MNTKKGPWTVVTSKQIYKNPWISVREDQVIRPDGKDGIFGVVEMQPGVSVLPIDDEGNIYLAKEYKYAIGQESIEVIAGGIDKGEDIQSAAKRELREESGITANKLIELGHIDPFTSVINSPNNMFLALELEFSETAHEGTEQIEIIKMPLHQAIEMIMANEITNGVTIAIILKAREHLNI
jgi:ADP-ribose pyrophosphatase